MKVERIEEIVYEAIANGASNDNEVEVYIRTYHPRLDYDKLSEKIEDIIEDYSDGFAESVQDETETKELETENA